MRNLRLKHYFILIVVVSFFLLNITHAYAATIKVKSIRVVMDDNYPPYSFRDNNGNLEGITIDQWKLFEKITGIKVIITGMDWNKAFTRMKNGEFDVVDTISYNKEREQLFDYANSYATIDVPIFFQKNISGITNVASLKGFTVAAKKGDNSINVLKENGITNIVEYNSAEAIVKAAKEKKLVIFVLGKPPALYYMYKMQIQDKFNYSSSLYTSKFYRAVKKGNLELLNILNEGFSKISKYEYMQIDKKWFGNTNPSIYDSELFRTVVVVIAIIMMIALFLFIWNRVLQRSVKQKTRELSNSVEKLQINEHRLTALLEAIKASEYTFRALFEGSADAVIIMEGDKFIDCNLAAVELFGYDSKESIIGKSPWKLSPEKQPDGYSSKEKTLEIIEATKKSGNSKFEWWNLKNDGTLLPSEIMVTSILLNGKKVFHILLRDINERKQMEDKLEYLSYHDQLTGLYNRRFFEEELSRLDVKRNFPLTIVMADVNGLKLVNDSFGHSIGDELLKKVAEVMTKGCRADDIIARLGGDEFVILLPKTDAYEAEQIVKRIKALAEKQEIESINISISFGWETKNHEEEKILEIFKKAEDYMYKKKLFDSPSMRGKTINTIISTLHEKNKREEQHSHRVSTLCKSMGEVLNLSEGEIEELKTVGLLHDIGKIAIEENILNKPDKLNDDEWEAIKRHPEIGYRILSTVNDMSEMAEYVLAHHERWDGKGYPKGLKKEEIPLQSRIITIVDAYDAMTSERSYRSALTEEIAIKELQKNSNLQFDPELTRVFIEEVLGCQADDK